MLKTKFVIILINIFFIFNASQAQISIGEWRIHSPYNYSTQLIDAGVYIYCISKGGVFRYNTIDNSTEGFSRVSGLSDVNVTCGAYSNGVLILGYDNGNIDIIKNNDIINIPYIKQKELYGSKRINNIFIYNNYAYLSCGFGIVQVNLTKNEIKDTYLIGDNSTQKIIYDFTENQGYFYAATEDGIYYADENSQNLAYYGNWHHIDNISSANSSFSIIECFNNKIYTITNNQLYYGDYTQWTAFNPDSANIYYDLNTQGDVLFIANDNILTIINAENQVVEKINKYNFPWGKDATHIRNAIKRDNDYFFADYYAGLIKHNGNIDYMIKPNGPSVLAFEKSDVFNGNFFGVQGGVTSFWSPQGKIPYVVLGFPMNIVPYQGFNMAGLSVASNEADTINDHVMGRRSYNQIMIQILKNSENFDEAIDFLKSQQGSAAENIMLTDSKSGKAAAIELTANHMAIRPLKNGVVYMTNHFVDSEMVKLQTPPEEGSSTWNRFLRLSQLLEPLMECLCLK
jgi:hypothetical protein